MLVGRHFYIKTASWKQWRNGEWKLQGYGDGMDCGMDRIAERRNKNDNAHRYLSIQQWTIQVMVYSYKQKDAHTWD